MIWVDKAPRFLQRVPIFAPVLAAVVIAGVSLSSILIIRGCTHTYSLQRSVTFRYLRDEGFLDSQTLGIDSYIVAISILRQNGIEATSLNDEAVSDGDLGLDDTTLSKLIDLIISGARGKNLGIKTPGPLSAQMYTLDGKRFDHKNFRLLARVIDRLAMSALSEKDVAKAVLLANGSLAIGVQLSQYDVDFIHMSGIAFKALGLEILAKCAEIRDDERLTRLATEMREELDDEIGFVMKMPVRRPSFWDDFSEYFSGTPEPNNTER